MKHKIPGILMRVVVLAACFGAGGALARTAGLMGAEVVLVWPAAGIALAAVLLLGYGFWWGVALGSLLYFTVLGTPLGLVAFAAVIGNTVGALLCAYLLERLVGFRNTLERVRDVAGLALVVLLGMTVTAAFHAAGLAYAGMEQWESLLASLIRWWMPNVLAALVLTPLLLSWVVRPPLPFPPGARWEALLCGTGLLAGSLLSFHSWYTHGIQNYPFAILPYPFLIWSALRFGQRGTTAGILVVSAVAMYSLLKVRGPFVMPDEQDSLMLIGGYLGILAVTNLLLAAAATERGLAQQQLAENEMRYRATVEDQTDLICRFTPDGRLTFVNEAYCRFHRRSRNELLGTSFWPLLSEEDRQVPLGFFANLSRENPTLRFDDRVRLPNGEVVWQQCTTRALFDAKGELFEYQMVVQDVTQRKQSEEAARHSAERLQSILSSLVDGVVVVDANLGCVTSFNPAAEKVFGRSAAAVLGQPVGELFGAENRAALEKYLALHLCRGLGKVIEMAVTRPDGTQVPIDLAASDVSLGHTPAVVLVARDISERKQAQEELREREEFFRLISESMSDMIAVLDHQGCCLYNSPSHRKLLGQATELRSTDSLENAHSGDHDQLWTIFEESLESGTGHRTEYRIVLKDGSIRDIESQGNVIRDESGKPCKVVVVSRDITERINLEAQLRQSQKMEAIGRLAGGIAHDFNNLMQAIIGYANLLLQRLPAGDSNRETVQQVERSADRAAALTRQLLAFSRKQVLNPKLLCLNSTVGEMDKLLRRLIGEDIDLTNALDAELGCVRADPGQIEQVVLNLALNGRDAMHNGGTLRIETANVTLKERLPGFSREFQPGPFVRLTISDSGTGMTPEVMAHLFEPFFTTKQPGKGTGLGLSIVYGIIRQSGGEIRVESRLGRGSSFHIYLPRMAGTDIPEPEASGPPQHTAGSETVLLVEDGEIVRAMLVEVLRAQGYIVLEAGHGEEALQVAARHPGPINLLVTDMIMPQMSGWELAERLSAMRACLPVLYISGYAEHEAFRARGGERPLEYLQKPFRPEAFLGRIRQILDGGNR